MEKIGTPISKAEWGGKEKCDCACYMNQCKCLKINKLWSCAAYLAKKHKQCCIQVPQVAMLGFVWHDFKRRAAVQDKDLCFPLGPRLKSSFPDHSELALASSTVCL